MLLDFVIISSWPGVGSVISRYKTTFLWANKFSFCFFHSRTFEWTVVQDHLKKYSGGVKNFLHRIEVHAPIFSRDHGWTVNDKSLIVCPPVGLSIHPFVRISSGDQIKKERDSNTTEMTSRQQIRGWYRIMGKIRHLWTRPGDDQQRNPDPVLPPDFGTRYCTMTAPYGEARSTRRGYICSFSFARTLSTNTRGTCKR